MGALILTASISATKICAAQTGYKGLFAPAADENKTTTTEQPAASGSFSFITPSKDNKDDKKSEGLYDKYYGNDKKDAGTTNSPPQGYKNYSSYDEYYKDQENAPKAVKYENKEAPVNEIKQSSNNPITNMIIDDATKNVTTIINSEDYSPISAQEKTLLSQTNLRGPNGLPLTASIKQKILEIIAKLEDKSKNREQKRLAIQEDISYLEKMSSGIKVQDIYMKEIYKKKQYPENYTSQLDEDRTSAVSLIDEALAKFKNY